MYSRTKPTVYAVHWSQINVFKIGFSDCQRWRIFQLRGATLLGLKSFDTVSDGLDFEAVCQDVLSEVCRPVFRTNQAAEPYLGGRGGGYLECFRVPADLMPSEILSFIDFRLEAFVQEAAHG
jgi:hypothetical protein